MARTRLVNGLHKAVQHTAAWEEQNSGSKRQVSSFFGVQTANVAQKTDVCKRQFTSMPPIGYCRKMAQMIRYNYKRRAYRWNYIKSCAPCGTSVT